MALAIGIDLGTTNSTICVFRRGEPQPIGDSNHGIKNPIVPSIVAIDGQGALLVGEAARSYVDTKDFGVREVKRKMGSGEVVKLRGKEFKPHEISAVILKKLKEIAEEALGETVTEVVLSVPANFSDAPRAATMAAGQIAGLKILRLIPEPTAAALAFGIQNLERTERLLVFDFGGGTLDISILEMAEGVIDVKCSFGDPELGGKDFDQVMIDLLLHKFNALHPNARISDTSRTQLKGEAEKTKIALSQQQSVMTFIQNFGFADGEPVPLEVVVTREEFEHAVEPLLARTRTCIEHALQAKQIEPETIQRVLLVGGTTYMPCVRKLVAERLGKELKTEVDPNLAVAMGASIQAGIALGLVEPEKKVVFVNVSPYGLGIPVVNDHRLMYEALIKPNTVIPFSVKRKYHLRAIDQTTVNIRILQDHLGRARVAEDAIETGIFGEIEGIPPSTTGEPHAVEIDFRYDIDGLVKLRASIPSTGQALELKGDKSLQRVSDEDVAKGVEEVEKLWQTKQGVGGDQPKQGSGVHQRLLDKAQEWASKSEPTERAKIDAAVAVLNQTLTGGEQASIRVAADALNDLLFDLENQ